jgi:NAD(P)-dependent dehydrogenase (short-subunit alcohol dehydrogenase family)
VAFTFASACAKGILFADLNEDGAAQAAEKSMHMATNPVYRGNAVKLDVTDSDSVTAMVEVASKELGWIDNFINAEAHWLVSAVKSR